MNILRFYKYGKGYWRPIITEDNKYFLQRERYGKYRRWWNIFELDELEYKQTGHKSWSTIMSPYFQDKEDAMKWVQEKFYPSYKLQKKLIKKEN